MENRTSSSTSFHQLLWIEHNFSVPGVVIAALHATTHAGRFDHLYGCTSRWIRVEHHFHHGYGRVTKENLAGPYHRTKRIGLMASAIIDGDNMNNKRVTGGRPSPSRETTWSAVQGDKAGPVRQRWNATWQNPFRLDLFDILYGLIGKILVSCALTEKVKKCQVGWFRRFSPLVLHDKFAPLCWVSRICPCLSHLPEVLVVSHVFLDLPSLRVAFLSLLWLSVCMRGYLPRHDANFCCYYCLN